MLTKQEITDLITALRAERQPLSISPERLGLLLQRILDFCDVEDKYIRKDKDDVTPYSLGVNKDFIVSGLSRFLGAIQSPDFLSGLYGGKGWQIDARGNAEVESIRVRTFMEIMELIVNRLSAIEGDQLLTEADTIEECTLNSDGTYTLKLQEKWDGYFTAQYEHNVIKGIFNNITNSVSGEGTTTINNATYYTSWMNILAVDAPNNTIRVSVYPDEDVPAGRNFPPCEMMKIARWGNSGDADDERYAMRQECLFLSSTEGRIVKYMRVTKPIITEGNIAFSLGTIPDFLIGVNGARKGDQGVYIDQLFYGRSTQINYKGLPLPTVIDRGTWSEDEYYYDGTTCKDENGEDRISERGEYLYERSRVSWFGCLWLCNKTGTKNPPSWTGTDWTLSVGLDYMVLEFDSNEDTVYIDDPRLRLGARCRISNCDLTEDPSVRWDWTRESWINGEQDTASDNLWNGSHSNIGREVNLEKADMNFAFGAAPEKLIFTVKATLLDAEGKPATNSTRKEFTESISFEI